MDEIFKDFRTRRRAGIEISLQTLKIMGPDLTALQVDQILEEIQTKIWDNHINAVLEMLKKAPQRLPGPECTQRIPRSPFFHCGTDYNSRQ